VPREINITGVFQPVDGQPLRPLETVTLAMYVDPTGGTPLWQETQNIVLDAKGHYAVLVGASSADGIPATVVAAGAQWLGITFNRQGEVEGPRLQLTSVPYALRAADADTLGGRPASAYLLAPTSATAKGGTSSNTSGSAPSNGGQSSTPSNATADVVQTGTLNTVAKYVNTTDVGNSAIFESGGLVGINTTAPTDALHVRFTNTGGSMTGLALQNMGNTATSYSGTLFYDQNGQLGQFQGFNNVTHEYRINNIASGGTINFMIGSASRLLVANNGGIGLGAVPGLTDKLRVAGNTTVDGNVQTNGQLQVVSAAQNGLRVQTNLSGGLVGSFGGLGAFNIDAPFLVGGRLAGKETGEVGMGIPNPTQKLSVAGTIESTTGGFKFPDGTVQNAAGDVYTIRQDVIPLLSSPGSTILHLSVPAGTYLVMATLALANTANDPFANNNRQVFCVSVSPTLGERGDQDVQGSGHATLSLHTVMTTTAAAGLDLLCGVVIGPGATNVTAGEARFTAMRIGGAIH